MLCRHVSYSCFYAVYVILALYGSFVLYRFKRGKAFKLCNRICNIQFLPGTAIHVNQFANSHISQMERHEAEGWMLFSLGNVAYLLDVLPRNTLPHHYHLHQFYFMLFKFKDLVAKQHPTSLQTINYEFIVMPKVSWMSPDPLLMGGVMEQDKITTKDTV